MKSTSKKEKAEIWDLLQMDQTYLISDEEILIKEYFLSWLNEYCQGFKITEMAVIDYMVSRLARKEKKQGFALHGGIGCGKTLLIKLYMEFVKNFVIPSRILFISCYDLVSKIRIGGMKILERLNLSDLDFLVLDDLGTELTIKNYGSEVDIVNDIILQFYDKMKSKGGGLFFTTNFSLKQIEQSYGDRTISRILEVCEWEKTAMSGDDIRLKEPVKKHPPFTFKQGLTMNDHDFTNRL